MIRAGAPAALVLAGALASVPCTASDWPQWRGPDRSGVSDAVGLVSSWTPGPAGSESVVWRQATDIDREGETSSGAQDAGSPVVVGSGQSGRVFFMHSMQSSVSARTVALSEGDGAFLWDYVTTAYGGHGFHVCPNHQGAATPYADRDRRQLYTGTKEGRLLAIDFNGSLVWRRLAQNNTNGEDPNAFGVVVHNCCNSTPLLDGERVVFPLCLGYPTTPGDPALVALNRETGETVWNQNFFTDGSYAGPNFQIMHGSWSAPILATTPDGVKRVFYQFSDGSLNALDAADGTILWVHEDDSNFDRTRSTQSHPPGSGTEGVASPVYNPPGEYEVASGAVYVSAGEDPSHNPRTPVGTGRVWKIDAQTGQEIWHYPASDNELGNVVAAVAVSGYRLYIGDTNGYLHCVDIRDGSLLWREQLGGGEIWASATVADGKVYLGTQDGDFYILGDSAAFAVLDVDNVGSPIASSAAVANGALYVKSTLYLWKIQSSGFGDGFESGDTGSWSESKGG